MVLGQTLTDKSGKTHKNDGALPIETKIDRPRAAPWVIATRPRQPLAISAHLVGLGTRTRERLMGGTSLFSAMDAR